MRLRNINLAPRATLFFSAIIALVVILGVIAILQMGKLRDTEKDVELNWMPSIRQTALMNVTILRLRLETQRALAEAVQGSVGGYDSPFEEAVAQGLRRLGWEVVPQIGVSRFRIDLGIVHPDRPGDYLAGVECDGATYHSAATARDRDKVRGAILKGLGWNLVRLWSTEWWVDKEGALQKLHAALNELLEASRKDVAAMPATDEPHVEPLLVNVATESGAEDVV